MPPQEFGIAAPRAEEMTKTVAGVAGAGKDGIYFVGISPLGIDRAKLAQDERPQPLFQCL